MVWERKLNIEQNDEMVVRMNEIQSRKWKEKMINLTVIHNQEFAVVVIVAFAFISHER